VFYNGLIIICKSTCSDSASLINLKLFGYIEQDILKITFVVLHVSFLSLTLFLTVMFDNPVRRKVHVISEAEND
jgi:hypothetical protein